ncbi:hypothetical protein ACOTC8_16165 [Achromobacter xylosoxidans]|uniref:hypothetical protein n=1 Tax=Alcaligenes xylosoxydans xylosoxydans TaxID=85698 RepID=UPI0006AC10F5|nr:hypothetical protein [Achromobacter xylosoxidans]KOQ22611.1 hypothetical protein ABW34_19275 [Achromobacter xylosoxidans]KOQ26270.1 hypothetical protein ABW35_11435 [Achromobacter xylosoxidans]KOQ34155.1 hypothetical protein ABW36_07230 [Achromobacter xylosoxidans]KOQ43197.1 hypothetical protein ABW37_12735 [Achromobacter xylosoxidans]KOQ51111.1 hypothetical protein ABW39_03680 [Achromobacter xylosoxidans]
MLNFDLSLLTDDVADQYVWDWMGVRDEPLSAEDYLSFAEDDLRDGRTARHLVNALSNIKKALHIRLEDVCLGFGARDFSKLRSFPALINYARECGLVAPRVLDRLNAMRNAVEHDYILPAESDVDTFLDVAHLFLAATDRWVTRRPWEVGCESVLVVHNSLNFELYKLDFDWSQGLAVLHFRGCGVRGVVPQETIEYRSPTAEFFACVRFALRNSD